MTYARRQSDTLQPAAHWWHRYKISTQKFAVVLSIGACVSVFGYVFLTNQTATQGFAIKDLQRSITQLQDENQKLELQTADLRSLSVVAQSSDAFTLEAADDFQVLTATGGSVALER